MSETEIRVRLSEFRVAPAPAVLKISGLGSCVAVALYDPGLKMGGLAHILLPGPAPGNRPFARFSSLSPYKYADQALPALLAAMIREGSAPGRLTAVIAGGANMFSVPDEREDLLPLSPGVGKRNVVSVKEHLERLAIRLRGEDVGGGNGRTVTFDTATGRVEVVTFQGVKMEF